MNEKAVDRAIGKLEAKLARGEVSIDDIPETEVREASSERQREAIADALVAP